jgi:peptidyl-prolyl cis-trans isomerase C
MQSKLKLVVFALTASIMAASPAAFAQTKAEKTAAKAAPAAAPAAPQSAKVNGVAIPSAYFEAMNKERETSGQPSTPDVGNAIKDELVNREILSQAARKKGLDKTPLVSAQMDMARQAVLIRAFFDDYVKANPISDAQLKTDYDKFVAQMGDKEYKARHVLVETEDEAKAVIASLGKGDSFEKVAKDKSKDTGSKDNGGDLDWGPAGRYVPEFGNAMKALKKGETTKTAVKSPFGFHVIRLDDVRDMKVPAFAEVKDNFKQRAQQEQITKLVQELRSKATVE